MTTFAKGTYYIGDPCYVVKPHSEWIRLLNRTNYLSDGDFKYKGKLCHASGTAYGDGCYKDNCGGVYPVDAGLISIIPMSVVKLPKKEVLKLGNIVKFETNFQVYSENGLFTFGYIEINTRYDDTEEDEE